MSEGENPAWGKLPIPLAPFPSRYAGRKGERNHIPCISVRGKAAHRNTLLSCLPAPERGRG